MFFHKEGGLNVYS